MRLAVFALMIVGCGGTPAAPRSAALTLGAPTEGGFAPFSDGQDVSLVAGAQGGFHVWMKYRASGMPAAEARLERTAHRLSDGVVVLRTEGVVELGPAGAAGWFESPDALPMFMCPSPIGISVVDVPIVFELRFSDASSELLHGAITLVPHCPDGAREFCQRICTG
jgi:hypothetical protein